ncbi:MAG: hypothetical protein MZV64_02820 [Ignavibacteriales bacterium]|nr:hypothetical protein [Ignavibacteriales bacterium]
MEAEKIKDLYEDFIKSYPKPKTQNELWLKPSKKFQNFWYEKIVCEKNQSNLALDEIDAIVRILDIKGVGIRKILMQLVLQ